MANCKHSDSFVNTSSLDYKKKKYAKYNITRKTDRLATHFSVSNVKCINM